MRDSMIETLKGISFDAWRTVAEYQRTEDKVRVIAVSVSRSRMEDILNVLPVLTTSRKVA